MLGYVGICWDVLGQFLPLNPVILFWNARLLGATARDAFESHQWKESEAAGRMGDLDEPFSLHCSHGHGSYLSH